MTKVCNFCRLPRYTFSSVINGGLAVKAPMRHIRPAAGRLASVPPRFPFDTA
ncbi:hypothetical protein ACIBF1_08825 [Spirillospora sp. NPDC050679]